MLKSARQWFWYLYSFLGVGLLMLGEWFRGREFSNGLLRQLQKSVLDLASFKSDQLVMVLSVSAVLGFLFWIALQNRRSARSQRDHPWIRLETAQLLKLVLVLDALLVYVLGWATMPMSKDPERLLGGTDQSTNLLVLLAAIALSALFRVLRESAKADERPSLQAVGITFFVVFFSITALFQADIPTEFKYRSTVRATGLWVNPNTFGLLMGTGFVLGAGLVAFANRQGTRARSRESRVWRCVMAALGLAAATLLLRGLVGSYSRGAWLATAAGLAYVGFKFARVEQTAGELAAPSARLHRAIRGFRRNVVPIFILVIAASSLVLWHFKQTELRPVRRALSVANLNDFSWRNRVAAWEGSCRMIADKPWIGFGWNRTEPIYDKYYRPPKVSEGAAVQMNDYLSLGTTLGLPGLICFVGLLWVGFAGPGVGDTRIREQAWNLPGAELEWNTVCLGNICRAGVIVLLVGFWFDGGLFKLATAVPFWVLLELGCCRHLTDSIAKRQSHAELLQAGATREPRPS